MKSHRILSHREDMHSVIFHLLVVTSYAAAFWIYLHPETANINSQGQLAAFVIMSILMLGWISGIDTGVNFHNHIHRNIFRNNSLNRLFERQWTVVSGWPAFCWRHSHITVHHQNILGPDDWTLPIRKTDGSLENVFFYSMAFWPWRSTKCLYRNVRSGKLNDSSGESVIKELLIFLLLWCIPFLIDPVMGILLWLLPQFVANNIIMAPGMYAQHFGCKQPDGDGCFSHSNTFTSKFFNLTMFNIGYHIEHHHWPEIHWSALPRAHKLHCADIIKGNGRILPFGYYRGGQLLSNWFVPEHGRSIFLSSDIANDADCDHDTK